MSYRFILLIASAVLTACTTVPDTVLPDVPVSMPDAWQAAALLPAAKTQAASASTSTSTPASMSASEHVQPHATASDQHASPVHAQVDFHAWWRALNDDMLNDLIDTAIEQNQVLATAYHRLLEARTLRKVSGHAFLPMASFGVQSAQDASAKDSYLQIGLAASWALAWPVERQGIARNALGEVGAAQAQWQAARVALVADVVRTYGQMRHLQHVLRIVESAACIDRSRAARLLEHQALGIVSAQSAAQAKVEASRSEATVSDVRLTLIDTQYALATLIGQPLPDPHWDVPRDQPIVPTFAIDRLPASLLHTRPQVALARAQLHIAAGRLGVAQAALYPRIALTGSWIYARNVTQNRGSSDANMVPTLGPVIDIPVFDWGLRVAQRDAQHHALAAATAAFRQAVLEGYTQTQRALNALNAASLRKASALALQTSARRAVEINRTMLALGLNSAQHQLDAASDLLVADRLDIDANAQRLDAFAALYQSLGGASALGVLGVGDPP